MRSILMLIAASIIFSSVGAFAEGQSVTMATITNVREIFRIITIREPITSREEVCEDDRGFGGAIIGGIAGGLLGNQFGRGSGNAAMTALGAVAGAATGQNMTRETKCYPRDRVNYVEREKEVIDGYIVTVESGEEFRTRTRYHVGDRVRFVLPSSSGRDGGCTVAHNEQGACNPKGGQSAALELNIYCPRNSTAHRAPAPCQSPA